MNSWKFSKKELLEILRKNRSEHKDILKEAWEGYKKKIVEHLDKMKEDALSGKKIDTMIRIIQPVDQTSDYDRAIKMLEMTVDENVVLDETQFANLVMDDWTWSNQFYTSNSVYSDKARLKRS